MNTMKFYKWMPGLYDLVNYKKEWLKFDIKAGLSVAAVVLPISIAYAELVGLGAIVGLYSSILPMIAYALFGSSKQLIVGPDTATCAVLAAVVTPLAAGNLTLQWQLAIIMSFMMGCWCLVASRFKLGALSDLLSQPILTGLLNGLSITIMVDQIPKIMGYKSQSTGLIEKLLAMPVEIFHSHSLTLAVSISTFVLLFLVKWLRPNWPGPLFAVVLVSFVVWLTDGHQYGIDTIDPVNAASSIVSWDDFQPGLTRDLVIPSLNLALISFVSMMLTVRSFAIKNGYDTNADNEFRALGIINIVSAFSQGFVVSGTSSRTAVNDSNGGKTQLVSIIAAVAIAIITLFFIDGLQYIPGAVLGVILIYASYSLIDLKGIWKLRKRNLAAFRLAIFTFVCVLLMGIIPGIGLAVLLGLLQFLRIVFRPTEQLLGINEEGIIHSLNNYSDVKAVPGVMMYRFNSPLTYFNVGYFKRRILNLVDNTTHQPNWVIIDAVSSFTHADISVLSTVEELKKELKNRNITLVLAGRRTELIKWFELTNTDIEESDLVVISDLYWALKFVQSKEFVQTMETSNS